MTKNTYCPICMEPLPAGEISCRICGGGADNINEPHQLPVGTTLNSRYLIGSRIGQGGFGITYIGRDLMLDMKVAVKEYFPSGIVSRDRIQVTAYLGEAQKEFESGRARFLEEARLLAKFASDPNIVCVRDFFTENGTAYIVMEYLEGQSLHRLLSECGPMSFDKVFEMLEPVMSSLEEVHRRGLIHRDISPSNLMLTDSGRVKLLDFGTAREQSTEGERSLSVILKPGFAPEEQYRSRAGQGPWTDVYALCATIYRLISGVTPENAMNRLFKDTLRAPSLRGADIGPAQEKVLMHGLAVRAEDRIRSVHELRCAFLEPGTPVAADDELTVMGPQHVPAEPEAPTGTTPAPSADEPDVPVYDVTPSADEPVSSETGDTADSEELYREKLRRRSKKTAFRKKLFACIAAVGLLLAAAAVVFLSFGNNPYRSDVSSTGTATSELSDTVVTEKMLRTIARDKKTTRLFLYDCSISSEVMPEFERLDGITDLYMSGCTGFSTLEPLAGMDSLHTLTVKPGLTVKEPVNFNGAEMFPVQMPGLTSLTLGYLHMSSGTDFLSGFPGLVSLNFSDCTGFDSADFLLHMPQLETLDMSRSDIGSANLSPVGSCTKLDVLSASSCALEDISWLSGLTELSTVSINANSVSSLLPLASASKLYSLSVSDNLLTSLDGICSGLRYLYAARNSISDISELSDCTELRGLELDENLITDLSPISACTELKTLTFDGNGVSDLSPISGCGALETLSLCQNSVRTLDACENMLYLETLMATGNGLESIAGLINCTQLCTLLLEDNRIEDISSLAKSTSKLRVVLLGRNLITDLSPLEGSTALEVLGAEENLLGSLEGLSGCTKLEALFACGNSITDISALVGCSSLYVVDLGENLITDFSALAAPDAEAQVLLLENNLITDLQCLSTDRLYAGLSLYGNPITDFSPLRGLMTANDSSPLYISWCEELDWQDIAVSGFVSDVNVVDAPADRRVPLEELNSRLRRENGKSVITPEFLSIDEADAQMDEYRAALRGRAGIDG